MCVPIFSSIFEQIPTKLFHVTFSSVRCINSTAFEISLIYQQNHNHEIINRAMFLFVRFKQKILQTLETRALSLKMSSFPLEISFFFGVRWFFVAHFSFSCSQIEDVRFSFTLIFTYGFPFMMVFFSLSLGRWKSPFKMSMC